MRPLLVLLLDGVGDRASPVHGGRTANEAAWTPNLDRLTSVGSNGLLWPLGPGRAPSSEVAHWALFGFRPEEFPGRAVMEARGQGLEPGPGEVLAHAALRPAERRAGAVWITGRVRPERAGAAHALLTGLGRVGLAGLGLRLTPLRGPGEAVLRITGGAHDAVTDSDPFLRERHPLLRPRPVVPEAAATAGAAEAWSRWASRALMRAGAVEPGGALPGAPMAVMTLKWWGRTRPAPTVRERHGVDGTIIGAAPFLAGLAAAVGLRFTPCPEGPDPAGDMARRLRIARERLDRGDTLVFCHLKATDEAGHTKDPRRKLRTIEAVDRALAALPERFPDAVLCVTGDHATPPDPEVIHSGDPVPFVLAGPGVRADRVTRFGEIHAAEGILGHLRGEDMMPVLLNAADRPRFLGARLTPVPGAAGVPDDPEPLVL